MKKYNKILLIDDDEYMNFYNKIVLNKSGVANEIIDFQSATEALDYLKVKDDIDLILLDINMPKLDGWGFIREFKKIKKQNLEIIMLSSSVNKEDKDRSESEKLIKMFLNKPLTKEKILEFLA